MCELRAAALPLHVALGTMAADLGFLGRRAYARAPKRAGHVMPH